MFLEGPSTIQNRSRFQTLYSLSIQSTYDHADRSDLGSSVNEQFNTRDETGVIRGQKQRRLRNFIGLPRASHRDRGYNPRNYVRRSATHQGRIDRTRLTSEHFAMSLECVQLGHDRGSSQFALQCRKQPLHVVLFKVKLMCRRRGEDLKEDQLMRVALP